ncbi:copper chaperone PCu(A)C [Alteromonas sediminis]|uniref:Copper chaperone PCu(A)C n=1 Tax=Alteromonas sediminis TaxID=2259342 RepID=A0A3N5XYR0_9ALTE|nr:copper chaperone PCu(A)C [Alteromonas sediminis]RPJ66317.1 copper chaperone PCu(A)C [Alteromonas sediminis]
MRLVKVGLYALLFVSFFSFATIEVTDAKARATFAMAKTGAAYLTITNKGINADVLERVTVASTVAKTVEIHTVLMDGEMMRMQALSEGLSLPPKNTVTMQPGGIHLMLLELVSPLTEGDEIVLTLHFKDAEPKALRVPVVKM